MNILIVEDDTAIREGVAEFLKENEYEVFCAGMGKGSRSAMGYRFVLPMSDICLDRPVSKSGQQKVM